jgi:hypothetical protein
MGWSMATLCAHRRASRPLTDKRPCSQDRGSRAGLVADLAGPVQAHHVDKADNAVLVVMPHRVHQVMVGSALVA